MTDARLPERWLNDRRLQRLSAAHYRAFINALLWSVANRTDGRIELDDLALIPHWAADAAIVFVEARLFTPQPNGWLISDYDATQTSRNELERLEKLRKRERENKAKQRSSGKASEKAPSENENGGTSANVDVPGTDPGKVPGGVPGTSPRDAPGRQEGRQAGKEGRRTEVGHQPIAAPCASCTSQPAQGEPHPFPHLCADCLEREKHPSMAGKPVWRGNGSSPYDEYGQ